MGVQKSAFAHCWQSTVIHRGRLFSSAKQHVLNGVVSLALVVQHAEIHALSERGEVAFDVVAVVRKSAACV